MKDLYESKSPDALLFHWLTIKNYLDHVLSLVQMKDKMVLRA